MSKSLRVPKVGVKQHYNFNDPADVVRAAKAINTRSDAIFKEFGPGAIYNNYVAKLIPAGVDTRVTQDGKVHITTSKNLLQSDANREAIKSTLKKETVGDIKRRLEQRMIQEAQRFGLDPDEVTQDQIDYYMEMEANMHEDMREELYSHAQELYNQHGSEITQDDVEGADWFNEWYEKGEELAEDLLSELLNQLHGGKTQII